MKIIEYTELYEIDDKYVIINTLTGCIIVLEAHEAEIFFKWQSKGISIEPTKLHKDLYSFLRKKAFIIEDSRDLKSEIIESLNKHISKDNRFNAVSFILTYDCNFRCPYCFEAKISSHNSGIILTTEMVDMAFKYFDDNIAYINLFGGEPLLPQNEEIIQYIISKKPDAVYSVITNGYYLSNYVDMLSSIAIDCIQVTIDGPEEKHNKTRVLADSQEGTYRKIVMGIDYALSRNIPIKIRMTAHQNNIDECIELRSSLLKLYSDYNSILTFEISPIFQLKMKEQNEILDTLFSYDLTNYSREELIKMNGIIGTDMPIIESILTGRKVAPRLNYCCAHTTRRYFDPFGNIYSCILGVGCPEIAIGSYFPTLNLKKNSIITRDITMIDACASCKWALMCGGGCPLPLIKAGKAVYSPNCERMHNVAANIIPNILKHYLTW